MMTTVYLCLVAFASGSIPFGWIIGKLKGIEIREHGSKNIGATNVWRVLGRGPGLACFILDVLKGLAPTLAAGWVLYLGEPSRGALDEQAAWSWLLVMAASVMGHMFSPWVGFKGGKGVATGLGALVGVYPVLTFSGVMALVVWLVLAWRYRYVSLASCVAAVSLPLWVFAAPRLGIGELTPGAHRAVLITTSVLAMLVVYKHRANIARLRAGTENRIGARVKPGQPGDSALDAGRS